MNQAGVGARVQQESEHEPCLIFCCPPVEIKRKILQQHISPALGPPVSQSDPQVSLLCRSRGVEEVDGLSGQQRNHDAASQVHAARRLDHLREDSFRIVSGSSRTPQRHWLIDIKGLTPTILRGVKRKWTRSTALGFWMWSFSFPCRTKNTRCDVREEQTLCFCARMTLLCLLYQLVEGVFELLQTVDELVLPGRFGAQSQDPLWWTQSVI